MTYLCFVDLEGSSTPHMEPLDAVDLASAEREAKAVLRRHASGRTALVSWQGEPVFILSRDDIDDAGPARPAWSRRTPVSPHKAPEEPRGRKPRRPLFR